MIGEGKRKVSIIVPPCIDWSMPLIAGAILKMCIADSYDVEVLDINQNFFNRIWGSEAIGEFKKDISVCISQNDLISSVCRVIDLVSNISYKCLGKEEYVQMRKARILEKWYDSYQVYDILQKRTSISAILDEILESLKNRFHDNLAFCVSISIEDQIVPAFLIMYTLKLRYPNTPIIIGGNIPSRLTDELVNSPLNDYFDIIVKGEGEESLLRVLDMLRDDPTAIAKQAIITSRKEKIQYSRLRTPDFSWCQKDGYLSVYPVFPITINRKCDWAKCEFCAIHSCWDDENRVRPMYNVIRDIKHYKERYGIKYFRIIDENVNATLLEDFANELLKESVGIYYEAYVRFDTKFCDKEVAEKVYNSGCRQLFWGIESIEDDVLKMVKKGTTSTIIEKNLEIFAQAGILNYCFILTGIPNVALDAEEKTIKFVMENHNIHVVAIGTYVVDRWSPMHLNTELHKKYGIALYDKGDLTTEVGYSRTEEDTMQVKKRTAKYIEELYHVRGDYALNAIMDEETRLILCSIFGNEFARESYGSIGDVYRKRVSSLAINRSTEERVKRNLNM